MYVTSFIALLPRFVGSHTVMVCVLMSVDLNNVHDYFYML
jgi:hypothetical protein